MIDKEIKQDSSIKPESCSFLFTQNSRHCRQISSIED